jgi:hypothetical protein
MLLHLGVGCRGGLGMSHRREAANNQEKQKHDARESGSTRIPRGRAKGCATNSQAALIPVILGWVPGTEAPLLDPSHND